MALADKEGTIGRGKLPFREQILQASKYIVGSSFSGSGNEASHQLTVDLELRGRAYGCGRSMVNKELMRGMATTCARATSACHPGYLSLCHCTIESEFKS